MHTGGLADRQSNIAPSIRETIMKSLFNVFSGLLWLLASTLAQAAPANGVWTTSTGDYFLLMQDTAKGQAIAVQVAYDLTSASIYTGTVSGDNLALKKLDQTATLNATATGTTMSGSYVQNTGASDGFSANLSYAYVGSAYDGVWQKTAANSYLAYVSASIQGKTVTIVLDLTLNTDGTVSYDVITGALSGNVFLGVSAMNGRSLKLTFDGGNTSGLYVTTSRQTTSFTAAQIFKIN